MADRERTRMTPAPAAAAVDNSLDAAEAALRRAQLLVRALERTPNWSTKAAFANCVANTRFTTDDPQVRAALTSAITEAWAMPYTLCRPALSLIAVDER